MSLTTPSPYAIRVNIEGFTLGLDNTEGPAPSSGVSGGLWTPYLTGNNFQGLRIFPVGQYGLAGNDYKEGVRISHVDLYDDFIGHALDTFKWNVLKGSDGSANNAINVQKNGVDRLTSGAGSTHTMAVNGAQTVGNNNFLVSAGGLRMETRLGDISALTSQSICFGLCDASTLTAPFTLAATTVTANGQNGACFLQDSAGTNTHLNAVAVNAGGSPQVVALTQDVDTAAFHVYRVEIDAAGNATYYIDGVLVATINLAVATTATLSPTVGMFSNATSASQTLDIDYMLAQAKRG